MWLLKLYCCLWKLQNSAELKLTIWILTRICSLTSNRHLFKLHFSFGLWIRQMSMLFWYKSTEIAKNAFSSIILTRNDEKNWFLLKLNMLQSAYLGNRKKCMQMPWNHNLNSVMYFVYRTMSDCTYWRYTSCIW